MYDKYDNWVEPDPDDYDEIQELEEPTSVICSIIELRKQIIGVNDE